MTTLASPSDLSNVPSLEKQKAPARNRQRRRNSAAVASVFFKKVRQFANTFGEKRLALLCCELEITADSFETGHVSAESYVRELLELVEVVHRASLRSLKESRAIGMDAGNVEGMGWNVEDAAGVLALAAAELARVTALLDEAKAVEGSEAA